MSDVFLGVIAAAVLIMAIIQVGAAVFALRAARRVGETVSRFEQDVKPIVANLQTLSSEAARATAIAAAQAERADRLLTDLTRRLEETAASLQSSIVTPAREGFAVVQGVIAALGALRPGGAGRRRQPAPDEEDPLFIG